MIALELIRAPGLGRPISRIVQIPADTIVPKKNGKGFLQVIDGRAMQEFAEDEIVLIKEKGDE